MISRVATVPGRVEDPPGWASESRPGPARHSAASFRPDGLRASAAWRLSESKIRPAGPPSPGPGPGRGRVCAVTVASLLRRAMNRR